jgi:prepilin-type N-terminal cleavage/methylation domain-containing protein
MRRASRGFTLIELMTVIAIIGVLTVVLVSISGTGSGTPRTTADRLTGIVQFARMRAESTRKQHLVRFQANVVSVWEATTTGYGTVTYPADFTQAMDLPNNVIIHSASSTVYATSPGVPGAQGSGLPYDLTIKPDGSTNGGTLFVSDSDVSSDNRFRVFFYKVTGTAMSREQW